MLFRSEGADEGFFDVREALNALIESSVCRLSEDGARVMLHRLQVQATECTSFPRDANRYTSATMETSIIAGSKNS